MWALNHVVLTSRAISAATAHVIGLF